MMTSDLSASRARAAQILLKALAKIFPPVASYEDQFTLLIYFGRFNLPAPPMCHFASNRSDMVRSASMTVLPVTKIDFLLIPLVSKFCCAVMVGTKCMSLIWSVSRRFNSSGHGAL